MEEQGESNTLRNEAWEKLIHEFEEPLTMMDGPLKMANMFAMTMANAKNADLNVKVPLGAEEWAETIFEKWFELVGQIAKSSGVRHSLLDRDLYDPRDIDNSPSWSDGLQLDDLPIILEDEDFVDDDSGVILEELYGPLGHEPSLIFGFSPGSKSNAKLSGQYNRLFPVKLVLRTAANLIATRDEYKILGNDDEDYEYDEILLEDLREQCLKIEKYARARFEWIDVRSGKNMGERLAVGLPSGKGEPAKIKKQAERFVSQFVGSVRNKGQGLPFELGLLDVNEDGEVQFTENGARFMLLENPLFDTSMAWKDGESFSLAEKQFLITMIRRNVPGEFDFMQKISNWISEGVNTPKPLEEQIIKSSGVSGTEASLMRSGTLARMIELSLVVREQKGRKVTYSLTKAGEKLNVK